MKYVACLLLVMLLSGCTIAAGSYPYAEVYEVNYTESDLIKKIEKFKSENPEYIVPVEVGLIDGRSESKDDHWYHIYFYYKKENQIVYTWLRPSGKGKTYFAIVSINNGLQLGNWKEINHDFSPGDNALQKEKFENQILNKIKRNNSKGW